MLKLIRSTRIFNLDVHTKEVFKKSASSLSVKLVGMLATFLVSITLGRTLGADGLGVINLTNQIIGFVLIFSMFGTYNVILKQTAIGFEKNDSSKIANTIRTALSINFSLAVFFSIIMLVITPFLAINVFNNEKLIIP